MTSISILEKTSKARAKDYFVELIENVPLNEMSLKVFAEIEKNKDCDDCIYLSHLLECYSIVCETWKEDKSENRFNFVVKERLNKYFE